MPHNHHRLLGSTIAGTSSVLVAAWLLVAVATSAHGETFTLKNGMQLEGNPGRVSSLSADALSPVSTGGAVDNKLIVFLDDGLRRTYFSSYQVQNWSPENVTAAQERIKIRQNTPRAGRRVASVGPITRITPFDEYGRRVFSMHTQQGPISVVQGITEITPTYTKVEGLQVENSFIWDMRIATSSIPRETLSKILMNQIDPDKVEDRLRIVRLYIQSERYKDARVELEKALKDFPELADLKQQVTALHQMYARRLIDEIQLRRGAGQHIHSFFLLNNFPEEGVAGETLLKVSDLLGEYQQAQDRYDRVVKLLEQQLADVEDPASKAKIEPVAKEIAAELNLNTIDRMADYLRLSDDEDLSADQKLSLAISGWLLGSGSGNPNLAVSLSTVEVRDLVRQYLRSDNHPERAGILDRLRSLEGADPGNLAKLIAHMKPAIETSFPEEGPPGLTTLNVPGLADRPQITYHVQLPPEYDPYRRYPCIITLNGAGTTPLQQIDWWAGSYSKEMQMRLGQASRHGYIVIAPEWATENQTSYEYTAVEHAAVLYSLRDACRRFSVDTDRVFLSGHSMGGDASWDIALAHPDLWAGVLPIVATNDKYISRYWQNGKGVPFYFVAGEMDGDRLSRNGREFDRYLTRSGFDCMVVEYMGRGHEHFHDEILRMFDWMELHRRDFFPREFSCSSMREWDNFFWWVELDNPPARLMVPPLLWPPDRGVRPLVTEGRILENNSVSVSTGAGKVVVWLSPEMVNFQQRVVVRVNSRNHTDGTQPSAEVLLEDVRTRGDRQHPFWARVEVQTGRVR